MLTRRSFLAGLITAPAIVEACNIMRVRPVENLFQIGPFANPDTLTIEHIRKMMEFMREAHISAFSSEGIFGLGYISKRGAGDSEPQTRTTAATSLRKWPWTSYEPTQKLEPQAISLRPNF